MGCSTTRGGAIRYALERQTKSVQFFSGKVIHALGASGPKQHCINGHALNKSIQRSETTQNN